MPYPYDSYSEPDEPGGGYTDQIIEPCADCGHPKVQHRSGEEMCFHPVNYAVSQNNYCRCNRYRPAPSTIRLTRLEKKVREYVREHPGCTSIEVADGLGHRPHYVHVSLEQLERLRWIVREGGGYSTYMSHWKAVA